MKRKPTKVQRRVAKAQALYADGVGPAEIARRLGMARRTIWGYIYNYRPCGRCGSLYPRRLNKGQACLRCIIDDRVAEARALEEERRTRRYRSLAKGFEDVDTRPVVRDFRKRKPATRGADGRRLTEKQRATLRLLQALAQPVSARFIGHIFATMPRGWVGWDQQNMTYCLERLEARGMVQRVVRGPRQAPFWLVPAAGRQSAEALTLDDGLREAELARLIEEQEREVARGDWAATDGRTFSLDRQFAEGGSFHDLIEDAA